MTPTGEMRLVINPRAAGPQVPYGPACASHLSPAGFRAALAEISTWPGYAPTPLVRLEGLARNLGLGEILYKDEAPRFGLGSFKALGGAYAVARVIARELARAGVAAHATAADLAAGRYREHVHALTVTSATDGNHGRSVAWGAQLFGCRCVIFIHATVSDGRREAIAAYGAEVVRLAGGYDDAVRQAFAEADRRGWHVVQDTATPAYRDVPADITFGYGVIAAELLSQCAEPPTHVVVQAGVGGLASAICARFWIGWGERRPKSLVLEPKSADCVGRSLAAGRPVAVEGDLETVMAGLSCGEVSTLAWEILREGADAAIAIDNALALEGMRRLASPAGTDPAIVAGECSGGAIGLLIGLARAPAARDRLGIDHHARILVIGTEGATDPAIYERVVGRSAAEVAASKRTPA